MKVLWVCNIMLPAVAKALGQEYSVREGWLSGILGRLLEETDGPAGAESLELGICFPAAGELSGLSTKLMLGGRKKEVSCFGFAEDLNHPEIYDVAMEPRFAQILKEFEPDLVHIFGTEFPHGLACAKMWNKPEHTLVGIQGLCCACAEHYMADLPVSVANSRTFRDILKKDSLQQQRQKFLDRAVNERGLLERTGHITGRTEFDKKTTAAINPGAVYHFMNETMRSSFYTGCWKLETCNKYEIFISQADYPLKGFHYLLQAMPEILAAFPEARIKVAGNSVMGTGGIKSRIKIPAYGKYLRRLVKENGLEGKVKVLGRLNEEQMKQEYLTAHIFVCPSSVENSPNSVAEAQLLGTPVAASNAGGIPSVVEDKKGGLLFEKGDVKAFAAAVTAIFSDDEKAMSLSESERVLAAAKYDGEANYRRLRAIYEDMMQEVL